MNDILNYDESNVKSKKRKAILDKSINIFIREGIHPVKMSDIANECGISLRSLYYYYPSKEYLAVDIQIICMSTFTKIINGFDFLSNVDYDKFSNYLDSIYHVIDDNQKNIKFITVFDYYFYNAYPNEKYINFLKTKLTNNFIFNDSDTAIYTNTIDFLDEDPHVFFTTIIQSMLAYAQKIIYREKAMLSEDVESRGELRIYLKLIKKAIKKC